MLSNDMDLVTARRIETRQQMLIARVTSTLPAFAACCQTPVDTVLLHQDAFAVDFRDEEYQLLGMAIKYAGLRGKHVTVVADPPSPSTALPQPGGPAGQDPPTKKDTP